MPPMTIVRFYFERFAISIYLIFVDCVQMKTVTCFTFAFGCLFFFCGNIYVSIYKNENLMRSLLHIFKYFKHSSLYYTV